LSDLQSIAEETPAGGAIVEVGVYKGGSAWYLYKVAQQRGDPLHLFDTFTGIPFQDEGDSNHVGEFSAGGADGMADIKRAMPDAHLHCGVFPETMPDFFPKVSFVHSDCDQYRSVQAVIHRFRGLLLPGGVMAFDDMDTPGGQKAILEAFPKQMSGQLTGMPPIHEHRHWWIVRKPG
jgi:hypothetical protein